MKYFGILRPMKSDVRSENVSWKISDYVSLPLFEFTLAINLRNFDFKSHWNTFIIFDRKRYGVRFEYDPLKNVWFCFSSIIWVHFSHKNDKFWFLSYSNAWNFFIKKKNDFRFEYVPSNSVWFGLSFLVWVDFWE